MPANIAFPSVSECISRAIKSMLAFYSNPDIVIYYGGSRILLPPANIDFSIQRLSQPATQPDIIFAGTRVKEQHIEKISSVNQPMGFRYELRACTPRTVFVRIAIAQGNENNTFLQATRIWDTLFAIFSLRHDIWKTLGIFQPTLDPSPVQVDDKQNIVLHGRFDCDIHVPFTRNAGIIISGTDIGESTARDLNNMGLVTSGFNVSTIWNQLTSQQATEININDQYLFVADE